MCGALAGSSLVKQCTQTMPLYRQHITHAERRFKMTLNEVPVGGICTVTRINGEGRLRRRIMDMGITKNVEIRVVKIAPLGDPMELNLRGYELSIRKTEAENIEDRYDEKRHGH